MRKGYAVILNNREKEIIVNAMNNEIDIKMVEVVHALEGNKNPLRLEVSEMLDLTARLKNE